MDLQRPTLSRIALPLLAFAAILAAYANHFHNSFHFDDIHTIVDNPAVRSFANFSRFFTDATTFSVLPPNRTWRPVLTTTLALDYRLAHGYNPLWFHISSFTAFLLQLLCMVGLVRATLTAASPATPERNRLIALTATAWYGLHPAIAETVNYIIQRGDVLSTLGLVAALLFYIRVPRLRRTGLYLVPLALALLSKPPALIFPVLLLAWTLLFAPADARTPRALMLAVAPSLILTIVLLALEAHLTPKSYAPTGLSTGSYLLTQPLVALRSFATFFLPIHLNVDTDLQPLHTFTAAACAGFLFLIALFAAIVVTCRCKDLRPIAFGLSWFALGLLPTSLYPLAEVENDHRLYLPFVGLVFAVTCAIALAYDRMAAAQEQTLAGRRFRSAAIFSTVAVLALYGYGVHRRNAVWRTEETLWADDVAKSPHNGRGLMIYGLTQMQKGDLPRALDLFQRASQYTPDYSTLEINLGVVYAALHTPATAEQHLLRALTLAPTDDQPHFYYGRFLFEQSRLPEAASQLQTALLLNGSRLEPHNLLTQTYAAEGEIDFARASASATLNLDPANPIAAALLASLNTAAQSPEAWLNRSLAAYQQHRYADSTAFARRALALRPDYAEAFNNIGAAEAALGDYDAAIAADASALRFRPDFPLASNNLAWAIQQKRLATLP